jgi:branched-chain amino acid transport system permease protein
MGAGSCRACLLWNPNGPVAGETSRHFREEIRKMGIARLFTTHRKLLLVGFFLVILIFLVTFPLYAGTYDIRLLTTILMYVILSVSWAMFSGPTGYMSLASAVFFGVGIYTMAMLQETLPFPVIIAVGGLICFAFALVVGLVTLRLKGMYFAIFTFGLVVFMSEIISYMEGTLHGAVGRHITPLPSETIFYAMLGIAVATLLVVYFIRRSRLGLAMLSIGGNEEAAAHMGINTTMVKVLTFAISTVFVGAAGVIMAPNFIYIDNRIAFSPIYSFMPILMSIFGGMGQLYGPVLGAIVFGYLDRTLSLEFPQYFMIIFGILLIIVILFLPNGLLGLIQKLQKVGPISKLLNRGKEEQHANT